ncbi:MAG: hypothetical protein HZA49_00135 [Planctomycetes bacterium]|nr:hypothetical protein [Planctomycetota bacterium]
MHNKKWQWWLTWRVIPILGISLLLYAADDVKMKLTDSAGVSEFAVQDSTGASVFRVNSDGNVTLGAWQGTNIAVANGGTGQATANAAFNALAPTQTGNAGKFLTTDATNTSWGTSVSGAIINLNASSNFATNINTGTSTGAVSIGNASATGISEQVGTGNYTLNGTTASNYTIGASTTTGTMTIGGTAQTGAITLGSSSGTQTLNLGTGAGASIVRIATGAGNNDITIGGGTVAAGNGVRIGIGKFTVNKSVAPTIGLNANTTATVAQILDAGVIGFAASAARTLTFPTAQGATGLVQALPGTPAVGDTFTFVVFNTGTFAVTLVAGAGGTIVNTNTISSTTGSRVVTCRVTGVTAGSETISIY